MGRYLGSGVWRHGLELNKALVIGIVYTMPHFSTIRQLGVNMFIFIYNIDIFQISAWREGFTACCHIQTLKSPLININPAQDYVQFHLEMMAATPCSAHTMKFLQLV